MANSAERPTRGRWRDQLRPWQRFPVRLMLWYGGTAALLVAGLSMWFGFARVDSEMDNLRSRIGLLATAAAAVIDGDAVQTRLEGPEAEAYWARVAGRLAALAEAEPDAGALYVIRWTGDPAHVEVLVDVALGSGKPLSTFREPYDVTPFPDLVRGLDALTVEPDMVSETYDFDGDGVPDEMWSISGYAPVIDSTGRHVGIVGVDVFASQVSAIRRDGMLQAGVAVIVALLLLGGVTVVLGRQIVNPLGEVIDATDAVAHGDLDIRIRTVRTDEFGLLGRTFDAMADGLADRAFLRDTFGRYVSPRVADAILANGNVALGGEDREVTIVFTDLRGYSTIAEAVTPAEVVRLLNDFFEAMNEIIDAHEGVVIEYTGDGLLVVFGAPVRVVDHPKRAVECALAMRARIVELNDAWETSGRARLWKDVGIDRVVMRIGVHTGRVVAGNLGSATRMKYAIIGDTVNVAGRLEQLNKQLETTILISGPVRAHLGDGFAVTPRGAAKVKGRGEPVEVFSL